MTTFQITPSILKTGTVNGLQDAVCQIEVNLTGTLDGLSYFQTYKLNLDPPNPENFTPFQSLSEEQVLAWLEASSVTTAMKEHVQTMLEKLVAESQLQEKRPPWEA